MYISGLGWGAPRLRDLMTAAVAHFPLMTGKFVAVCNGKIIPTSNNWRWSGSALSRCWRGIISILI